MLGDLAVSRGIGVMDVTLLGIGWEEQFLNVWGTYALSYYCRLSPLEIRSWILMPDFLLAYGIR
ncbi:acyl-CoA-binding protein [Iris pallida]|uniref:Acyl-CoA-binding protein n=1 Tax=Iris pallida TaxID=29817 RepID=A0AAX6I162_IRIPA|nr:acyl-CoA-binding protein [Iris pallida]